MKKRFLTNKYYFFNTIILLPLYIITIPFFIKFASEAPFIQVIMGTLVFVSLIIFLTVYLFIPATSNVCFYDEYFVFKKNIFVKSILVYYSEITKAHITFVGEPPPGFGLREFHRNERYKIFVCCKKELICYFDFDWGLLKEFLKHVEKNKLKIKCGEKRLNKREYNILHDFLTEKQKKDYEKYSKK